VAVRLRPSLSDIVRCRVRTTGIIEQHYTYKGAKFHIFDVGGQRNERKKWIYLFENVTAVLFVAALSSYDQPLYEDSAVNRMHESLRLFEEICGLQWFQKASVILFLNKLDLFAEKINVIPLSVCFPDFKFNTAGSTSIGKSRRRQHGVLRLRCRQMIARVVAEMALIRAGPRLRTP